jgi:hypothetical protein
MLVFAIMDFTTATAPAWFVVGIAGAFTILGGLLSTAGSWRNEKSRFNREKKHQQDQEVITYGAQYLAAAQAFGDLALKRVNRSHDDFLLLLEAKITPIFDEFSRTREQWQLVSPTSTKKEEDKLVETTLILAMPLFDEKGMSHLINEQSVAIGDFRNAMRKVRGLKPLPVNRERRLLDEEAATVLKMMSECHEQKTAKS